MLRSPFVSIIRPQNYCNARSVYDLGFSHAVGDGGTGKTTFVKVRHPDAAQDCLLILLSYSAT
jgi:hypothetical protein